MRQKALNKLKKEMLNTFGRDAVIGFGAAIFPTSYKGTLTLIDVLTLTYFELINVIRRWLSTRSAYHQHTANRVWSQFRVRP